MRHLSLVARGCAAVMVFVWALLGLTSPTRLAAQQVPPAVPKAPGKFIGAARCGGPNCHDQLQPAKAPPYMQEYRAWSAINPANPAGIPFDRHSWAWQRLNLDPASPVIMAALNQIEGTNEQAAKSERCLTCHGVAIHDFGVGQANPGAAVGLHKKLQGAGFRENEGISCDGCHGPAEKWFKPHDKLRWTINQWNALGGKNGGSLALYNQHGIYYSKDIVLWAEQCVRCHLRIDTNMLDAGHPDLIPFELFGQDEQVPHWRDYSKEHPAPHLPAAGPSHAAVAWAVGQAVTLRSAAQQLIDRTTGTPHDKVSAPHVRNSIRRLGSHWLALRAGLASILPATVAPLEKEIEAVLAQEGAAEPDCAALTASAKRILPLVQPLPRALADANVGLQQVEAILVALAADEKATTDWVRASILLRSLDALNHARQSHKNPAALEVHPSPDPAQVEIDAMFDAFEPEKPAFKEALEKIRAAVVGK